MEKVFIGNGIEIEMQDDRYFLIYDAGEICERMERIEISKEEVKIAQKSTMDAYNIIIKYQNKMSLNKD